MPVRSSARILFPAALLAATLSLSFAASSASAYDCQEQVSRQLQEHGVSQSDVESVTLARRAGGAKSPNNFTFDAWVRLKSCSNGALVVNMTDYCMVQDVYTSGDCRVGDLPNY
jgi:hypothetical protein